VVNSTNIAGFTTKAINDLFEKECQMAAADKLQEDTNEAKNALESYIYDLRNKLYGRTGALRAGGGRDPQQLSHRACCSLTVVHAVAVALCTGQVR